MATQNRLNCSIGSVGQALTANSGSPPSFQSNILSVSLTLTSSQIKNLVSTPITLLSSPGSSKYILLLNAISVMNYAGTNGFTASASQTISLYYTSSSGIICTQTDLISNSSIVATQTNYCYNQTTLLPQTNQTNLSNKPIVIINTTGTNIAGNAAGDNTITIFCYYTIVQI